VRECNLCKMGGARFHYVGFQRRRLARVIYCGGLVLLYTRLYNDSDLQLKLAM